MGSGHNLHTYEQASKQTPRLNPGLSAAAKTKWGLALAAAATGVFFLGRSVGDHFEGRHETKKHDGNLGQKVHGDVKHATKAENKHNMKDDTRANLDKMANQYYEQPAVKKQASS